MKITRFIVLSIAAIAMVACKDMSKEKNFSITTNKGKTAYQLGNTITVTPNLLTGEPIDAITYTFQGESITPEAGSQSVEIKLDDELLGIHKITAKITSGDFSQEVSTNVTILNNKSPKVYGFEIVNTYPHNIKHFTQGLEFDGDQLYESAGKNGQSKLLLKDLKTGETLQETDLNSRYFAEGLTVIGDKIHQLTWKSQLGFTYDKKDFKQTGTFAYKQSKEGWGLCHNEDYIFKSDGSSKIYKLNKETLAEEGYIQIATNTSLKSQFNELEWVNGKIYANTWQKDGIAIINPKNGAIDGIINLKGLREKVGVHPKDNSKVLNGIAYKPETEQLYVTGKYWNSLFEIKVVE